MNSSPLVTIMIPAYNQAATLPAAVESALAQDYPNLDIVISDDCSGDGTADAARTYLSDRRVRYFRNESNLGRVANYKHTLEVLAQGEWVVNLDADDYYTDGTFISRAMKLILEENNSGTAGPDPVVFLQAGHTVKTGEGKILHTDIPAISSNHKCIEGKDYFLDLHHFSHMATLFNRKNAMAIGFYRYDILSADMESLLRLALHGRVILLRESIGVWVHHGSNESRRLNKEVVEKNMLRIDAPYVYAKSLGVIPETELLRWRNKMTRIYIQDYLTRTWKGEASLTGYFSAVLAGYPQIVLGPTLPMALFRAAASRISRWTGIRKKG